MRISDWSLDVCSSDLISTPRRSSICRRCASNGPARLARRSLSAGSRVKSHWWGLGMGASVARGRVGANRGAGADAADSPARSSRRQQRAPEQPFARARIPIARVVRIRSEEHTSELQSLMRISYAVFCLKKKIEQNYDAEITAYELV